MEAKSGFAKLFIRITKWLNFILICLSFEIYQHFSENVAI